MEKLRSITTTNLHFLYNIGIRAYGLAIRIVAIFNNKAQLWLIGRKKWRSELSQLNLDEGQLLWIHSASLGEIEQGVPVIKNLRNKRPDLKVVISFFSPSGYLNFKQRELADAIIYLPLDLPKNAKDFLQLLQPDLALFLKYEIWPNFLSELKKKGIPTVLAPAVFRDDQIYFKPYGGYFRRALEHFQNILVQDQKSLELLKIIGISADICGDSRFDQAQKIKESPFELNGLDEWIDQKLCLVAGSSWPKEEELLVRLLKGNKALKLILAPHEVEPKNISRLSKEFEDFGLNLFSESAWSAKNQVLIVDNIGQLKMLYRFADLALIGGGFGQSVHSTVEPAIYEIPIAFGPNHKKFVETKEMVQQELAFEIHHFQDLDNYIKRFNPQEARAEFKPRMHQYLKQKTGAADKISKVLETLLDGKS